MASKTHEPQSAAGTNWNNPTNALTSNGTFAVFPKTVATVTPLALTNLTNRTYEAGDEMVGLEVSCVIGGSGGPRPPARGLMSTSTDASVYDAVDNAPNANDGDLGTYYGYSDTNAAQRRVEVIIDLGEGKAVSHIKSTYYSGVDITVGSPSFYKSTDGVSWTAITLSGPGPIGPPGPGSATWDSDINGAPHTARFFKIRWTDPSGSTAGPRIYNFRLYTAGGAAEVVRTITMKERIEVALTLDGTNAAGSWKQIEVAAGGGTTLLGGVTDLWGNAELFGSDLTPSTFGFLTRRKALEDGNEVATDRSVDFESLTSYYTPFVYSNMATRPSETQLCLLGKESTKGQAASPTIRLKAGKLLFSPANDEEDIRYQGDLLPGDYVTIAEKAESGVDGYPTYDEMGLLLASVLGKPSSELVDTGVYRHTFVFDPRGITDPQTYTQEYGDSNHAERVTYAILAELGFSWSRRERIALSGRAFGQKIVDNIAGVTAGVNAVHTLTISGTPTGGTYKLRFKGQTTSALAFGANAAAIEAALNGLSSLGADAVAVSGTGPFTITFDGTGFSGKWQPGIDAVDVALTGGSSPDAAVVITTLGGYTEFACVPILPGHNTNYYAATIAGLAAGKLSKARRSRWAVGNRFEDVWWLDASAGSFSEHAEAPMTMLAGFVMNADSGANTIAADVNALTGKYLRQEWVGPVISGGNTYKLTITMAVKVRSKQPFQQDGVIYGREFEFGARFDPTWGRAAEIVLINATASY